MTTGANHHPRHALRHALERHASAQQAMVDAARELLPPIEPAPDDTAGQVSANGPAQ